MQKILSPNNGLGDADLHTGVRVIPKNMHGRDVTVIYNGLLAASGCHEVYLHSGYGEPQNWSKVYDHRMEQTPAGWQTTINMEDQRLNFCFKDCADNWDNNNGQNWAYLINAEHPIQP